MRSIRHSRPSNSAVPGREDHRVSAWVGVVPKQNSSGGKKRFGGINERYLRSLFTAGALALIRYAKIHGTKHRP